VNELLQAVERFLEREVVPSLEGPKQYHARVAANLMRILAREIELGERFACDEWKRLDELSGEAEPLPPTRAEREEGIRRRTGSLCDRIRRGDADTGPWRSRVLAHVRRTVEEKLEIAKPEMVTRAP
jgi:hypothetical protein